MKKSIFLFFAAILCAISVQGAVSTPKGKYFYFKTWSEWKNDGARFAVCFQWKDGGGQDDAWVSCTAVPGATDIYYVKAPDKYWDMYFCRMNGSNQTNNWSNKWNQTDKLQYDGSKNYWTKSAAWNGGTTYSTYAPAMSKVTLEDNGTSIVSGSGTQADPYLVYTESTIKVKASGTKSVEDPDAKVNYDFKQGTTSKQNNTTATYQFTASATADTEYTINLDGYTKVNTTSSTKKSATALYYKTVEPAEETHNVTVSYMFGSTKVADPTTVNTVGVNTPVKVTAPEIAKYTFANWTLGADVATTDALTSNEINITTKAGGSDFTLVANYEKAKLTYTVTVPAGTENCYLVGAMNGWDVANPIEMTKQGENVFTTTLEGVATTDEYKYISQKGSWDYADVQEANRTWTANDVVTAWKDPLATNVHLAGTMTDWGNNKIEFKKATKEATTASIILNLTAGDYKFKIVDNGSWLGNNATIDKTISGWTFAGDKGDCPLKATIAGDYTFTWAISTKKLSVTYPTICAITATANDAAMGTIEGTGDYGKGSTAILTATPNDGYLFVNWTKGGEEVATTQEYSFKVTEAVALVANFEAAPEEVHNVTVSYVCGGNKIADDQTVAAVGETSPKTVEAPAIFGYTFSSWKLGAGVTSADVTANPISINIVAGASDYTLTANYTEIPKVKIYVVNNKKWSKVNVYGWKEGEAQGTPAWPGQEITASLETEKVAGFDVYSYSVVPGSYDNLILNNGSGEQTGTYKWTDGKYYYVGATENYAGGTAEEVATALGATASYDYYIYGNMNDWKEDANYGMTDENEDGIYEKTLTFKNNAEFKVKGTDWYGFESVEGTYKEVSDNGGNIKLSLSADTEVTVKFNSETKKITFEGLTKIVPKYYLVGTFNEWNPADPNYEMTLDGGLYKKEVTFAKDVQFKVCNGSWSASWGKDNLGGIKYNELTEHDDNIKTKEAKTFTVIFNPAENLILFEGLTEKVTYVLMGVNGDWETGIELVPNPKKTGEYMLLGQPIAKATDAVKVVKIEGGSKKYCQYDDVKDGSVACTKGEHNNIILEDGFYHFYYEVSVNKVFIAAAKIYTRTVPEGDYGTICLNFGAKHYTGATFYEVAGKEGNKVVFDEVTELVAGRPYIFMANAAEIKVIEGDITVATTPSMHNSLQGTFTQIDPAEDNILVGNYMVVNNSIKRCGINCGLKENRAYFVATGLESLGAAPQPMPGRRRVAMGVTGENQTTGFENITAPEGKATKVLRNGQIIIIRNGEMYNAQGQKL